MRGWAARVPGLEADAFACELIEMGGADARLAVAAEVAIAEVFSDEEDNVGFACFLGADEVDIGGGGGQGGGEREEERKEGNEGVGVAVSWV